MSLPKTHFWILRPTPKCKSELCLCKKLISVFLMVSSLLLAVCVAVAALAVCQKPYLQFEGLPLCAPATMASYKAIPRAGSNLYSSFSIRLLCYATSQVSRLSYTLLYTLCLAFSRARVSTRQFLGEDYQRQLFSLCVKVAENIIFCFAKSNADFVI